MEAITVYNLNVGHRHPRLMFHQKTLSTNNEMVITGWDPDKNVKPGFVFIEGPNNKPMTYTVREVIERRDHKGGGFTNPDYKKDSFFKAVCTIS